MLNYLFDYLQRIHFPGAGLFSYISFRAIFALVVSIVVSIWFGKWFIRLLKRRNISETQRDERLDPFGVSKVGVPTMGGVIIISAILIPCLLIGRLENVYMQLMIITTVILGALGFADDYIKTFRKNKDGLNGWVKILGQVVLGLIVGLTLRYSPQVVINEKVETKIENNTEIVVKSPDVKSTR
ncbi:MAG: phospho-N-acetylmuramoyl-pentapeptide-transferase, partial [Bacteroidaceae bacterium]|nr:phospho-N-acetylmuramoyl-pentapeptide-transferase [Bacteroidaceae bacterium]